MSLCAASIRILRFKSLLIRADTVASRSLVALMISITGPGGARFCFRFTVHRFKDLIVIPSGCSLQNDSAGINYLQGTCKQFTRMAPDHDGGGRMAHVGARVPVSQKEELAVLAWVKSGPTGEDVNVSDLVRTAINEYLEKQSIPNIPDSMLDEEGALSLPDEEPPEDGELQA